MRYALVMLSFLALTGCATTSGVVTAKGACSVWPHTTYAKEDTPPTIEGNKLNNARRKGFCGD